MNILVIAEHDNASISDSTRRAVMAAAQMVMFNDAQVHLAVIGDEAGQAAQAGAHIAGVAQVIHLGGAASANSLSEDRAAQIAAIAPAYSYILLASTALGQIIAQHLAAWLGVTLISEIVSIESADTFGHAPHPDGDTATVQSTDGVKVLTVCITSFEAVPAAGGSATVLSLAPAWPGNQTPLAGSAIAKNGRLGLTAAKGVMCAADNEPVFCGYCGPLGKVCAAIAHEGRPFVLGDPHGAWGLGLRAGPRAFRSEPVRGAVDFVNPGI